eukprot:1994858-Pyramimonas_sp.AAC.1
MARRTPATAGVGAAACAASTRARPAGCQPHCWSSTRPQHRRETVIGVCGGWRPLFRMQLLGGQTLILPWPAIQLHPA